jgi:uncharacterized protein
MELTLFLDHQCNLRCTYCYTGRKFSRPMSHEILGKSVDLALARAGSELRIAFFGGEPLLHFALMRETEGYLAEALTRSPRPPPSVRWLVNTNATLLTDDVLDWLAPPRAATVFVSLDGPRDVHDARRVDPAGRGTYDRVRDGIGRLHARQVPFAVLAVIGTASASAVGRVLEELLPLGAQQIHLALNYRDLWQERAIADLREGLATAAEVWMAEFRAGRTCAVEPLHTKILTHLKGGIPCPSRCLLEGDEFTVAPSGRIYSCAQMVEEDQRAELVIGHVNTGFDWDQVRRLAAQKERVEELCAPCALRDRCQSHCGCRHLALSGELGRITRVLCEVEAALVEAADRLAATLFRERCPAFLDYYYRRPWVPKHGAKLTQLRRGRDG